MTWTAFLLMLAFLITAVIQYGLAIYTIRDATRRERLRGPNKASWILIILCLPFLGPLLYVAFATDGLPVPRPDPSSTWPGRRWRGVRRVAQAGESLIRAPESADGVAARSSRSAEQSRPDIRHDPDGELW